MARSMRHLSFRNHVLFLLPSSAPSLSDAGDRRLPSSVARKMESFLPAFPMLEMENGKIPPSLLE
jgi:hypothetical protein